MYNVHLVILKGKGSKKKEMFLNGHCHRIVIKNTPSPKPIQDSFMFYSCGLLTTRKSCGWPCCLKRWLRIAGQGRFPEGSERVCKVVPAQCQPSLILSKHIWKKYVEMSCWAWNRKINNFLKHLPGGGCIILFTRPIKLKWTGYVCPSVITSTFPLYDI